MIGLTGAGGRFGGGVLRHLKRLSTAGERIVACTRDPGAAPGLDALASEVRRADFAHPESLASAFGGIRALLIISVEGEDEERIRLHANAIKAARGAGVRRIVYTSFSMSHRNRPRWSRACTGSPRKRS